MSVNKLGLSLFSSFLIFATAPLASARTQNGNQDTTTSQQQTQKKTTASKQESTRQKSTSAVDDQSATGQKSNTSGALPQEQTPLTSPEDVKNAQQALSDLGYNPGDANGMMSSDTQQAVREFQWFNDLPVTGKLDEQTAAAIDA